MHPLVGWLPRFVARVPSTVRTKLLVAFLAMVLLFVLLGAVGLGRTLFGVLLVLAYGVGMAGTLTAAGLTLVGLQRRWARRKQPPNRRWLALSARLGRLMPTATGSLVLLVGLGLVGRAAATLF